MCWDWASAHMDVGARVLPDALLVWRLQPGFDPVSTFFPKVLFLCFHGSDFGSIIDHSLNLKGIRFDRNPWRTSAPTQRLHLNCMTVETTERM